MSTGRALSRRDLLVGTGTLLCGCATLPRVSHSSEGSLATARTCDHDGCRYHLPEAPGSTAGRCRLLLPEAFK